MLQNVNSCHLCRCWGRPGVCGALSCQVRTAQRFLDTMLLHQEARKGKSRVCWTFQKWLSSPDQNNKQLKCKLDPVGSTVRYEMMKLCTGSVKDTMRRQQLVIDDTGSVEDIHAFIYCKQWKFGQVSRMPDSLTHKRKDRATQLLIKYKYKYKYKTH